MKLTSLKLNTKNKKFELNIVSNIILIFLFSLIITVVCFALQPNSISQILACVLKTKIIFMYNFIPVLLFVIFFFAVTNNIFYSSAIVSILFGIASLINRYKILYRDDPFVPIDISLGAEVASIMTETNMKIDLKLLFSVLIPIVILFLIGFFIKSKKINLILRISTVVICIVTALVLNNYIYKSSQIYDKLPTIGNRYYITGNFNSKGFIYCFFYNINTYSLEVPDNYNKHYAEKLNEKYTINEKKAPQKKPNIIIIQSEGFSDISTNKSFIFTPKNDPLKNFKKIGAEGISGHMIVPGFGGDTANTEYDVLTGCLTNNLSKTNTSAFRLVRKNIYALPRFFTSNGYDMLFIHPGQSWFYNRTNVYNYFGMDNQIFIDQFKKPQDFKSSLVSDSALVDKLITEFNNHTKTNKSKPLFNFTVTIQNHMPYLNRYGSKIEQVKTNVKLSPTASNYISNYILGVRDADNTLGRLVEFFKQSKEPVVLMFFGDHLPNLGENYLTYKELGFPLNENGNIEATMDLHKVPFILWANDQARSDIAFDSSVKKLNLPPDRIISANYVSSMLYELLGYKGINPFYDFLGGLRKSMPVITRNYYKIENSYTSQLPENLKEKVQDYKIWQYYKMEAEKVK
jgi:phosphoglycerol transferase MdoB-like AlkP superfamily enzyme